MHLLIKTIIYFIPLVNYIIPTVSTCGDPLLTFHQKSSVLHLNRSSEQFVILTDLTKEDLRCTSSQNIEWIYEGNGEPSKLQESSSTHINAETEDGSLEYCMTSKISFYPKQSDTDIAKHTGKYTCREIGNFSNFVSVYVFVRRRNAPAFLHSRETKVLTLTLENVTDSSFVVPCVTSTPFVNATLLFRGSGSVEFKKISEFSPEVNFDPMSGFHVRLPSGVNVSAFYGDYKCTAKLLLGVNKEEDTVTYSMIQPSTFRAYPPESTIFTTMLNLTCESAEEPVILKEVIMKSHSNGYDQYAYEEFDDDQDYEDDEAALASNSVEGIEETIEKNGEKRHVANFIELNPLPYSTGEFQCLSEISRNILHTWQYVIIGKKEEKLAGIKFNKRESSFSCRTKKFGPGRLSFVTCRTPSECRINAECLKKSENCRGYSNATKALCHRGNHFCGKIFYKGGSGLIRCIGEGIDEIRDFTDESTDGRLRMGFHKLKPSETAYLSLTSSENNLLEGNEIGVTLKLGYYYFLQPVQWSIKLSNGTSIPATPTSEELNETKLYREIRVKISLPIVNVQQSAANSSHIIGINALIPLRSSVPPSWKIITLPIVVNTLAAIKTAHAQSPVNYDEAIYEGSGRSEIQFEEETTQTFQIAEIDQNSENNGNGSNLTSYPVAVTDEIPSQTSTEDVDVTTHGSFQ